MNVYRVTPFAKPTGSKFDYYAQLSCKPRDEALIRYNKAKRQFDGSPYPKPWRKITLHYDNPLWPRSDFLYTGMGHFGCNVRARELVGPAMEKAGEFLPVRIEGEEGEFFIYNVTKCGEFIDPMKSVWEHEAEEPEEPEANRVWKAKRAKIGQIAFRTLKGPAFVPRKIGIESVFKLKVLTRISIYCAERTGDPAKREFKALVEHHKLTGLKFDFAWSEKRGVVTEDFPPLKGSPFVWRTGDGNRYKRRSR